MPDDCVVKQPFEISSFFLVGFLENAVAKGAAIRGMNTCLLHQMVILPGQIQLNVSFRPYSIISSEERAQGSTLTWCHNYNM